MEKGPLHARVEKKYVSDFFCYINVYEKNNQKFCFEETPSGRMFFFLILQSAQQKEGTIKSAFVKLFF